MKETLLLFGGAYSHTDEASYAFPERDGRVIVFSTDVDNLCKILLAGEACGAILPYTNSNGGLVQATQEALMRYSQLRIVRKQAVNIIQNLAGLRGTQLREVQTVYSHPQALRQCRDWLERNLPNAELSTCSSTVDAADWVLHAGDRSCVCICAKRAVKPFGLCTIASGIQSAHNKTTFVYVEGAARD